MYFFIEDHDSLEKYNTIWDKISPDIKKEYDSDPVYNKENLNSTVKKDENYFPHGFLKECKYIGKKVFRHIHENLSNFSSSSYESDEE